MGTHYQPVVGDWYETATGEAFEVVALDPDEGTLEIQYFDGAIEELELETWLELDLIPIEPPEDYSGSLDISREDYGIESDDGSRSLHFGGNPLEGFDFER